MPQHTPTPYYVGRTGVSQHRLIIDENTRDTVAVVYDTNAAAFLVHAANHHDRLRATVADLIATVKWHAHTCKSYTDEDLLRRASSILLESGVVPVV